MWYGIIGIILFVEAMMLLDSKTTTPPLTKVLVAETHWWVTMPVLVWLVIHFGSRFLEKHGIWRSFL